jgi:hypothetical protein
MEVDEPHMLFGFFQDDLGMFSEQSILLIREETFCENENLPIADGVEMKPSYRESLTSCMPVEGDGCSTVFSSHSVTSTFRTKKEQKSTVVMVKRCRNSNDFYDVRCLSGRVIRVTRMILACFFDLTLEQTASAMMLGCTTIKKLRIWSGLSRWPRSKIILGRHPAFTLESIRSHRTKMMTWAISSDIEMYGCFERACLFSVSGGNDRMQPISSSLLDKLDVDEETENKSSDRLGVDYCETENDEEAKNKSSDRLGVDYCETENDEEAKNKSSDRLGVDYCEAELSEEADWEAEKYDQAETKGRCAT